MVRLLDFLCHFLQCTPNELNNRMDDIKDLKNILKIYFFPDILEYTSDFDIYHIIFRRFLYEPANIKRIYWESVTVAEYYKRFYGVILEYPHLYCLQGYCKDDFWPIELVYIQLRDCEDLMKITVPRLENIKSYNK